MRTAPTTSKRLRRAALIALAAVLLVVGLGLTGADIAGFGPGTALAQDVADAPAYRPAPQPGPGDYPRVAGVNSRVVVWLAAQLHLWFAAFVLAVPIFVLIIEAIGMATRDERYDKMAYEFIKVSITAYSLTAILGGFLLISLIVFYPDLMGYLAGIFKDSMFYYALMFFVESACLYLYYYGWHWLQGGFRKWVHLTIGLMLNAAGTTLMFLANAWLTFMMSPAGVDGAGVFTGDIWAAIHNHLWNPINLHRFIANIAFGGSIVGAYAAYKFLSASGREERAHYDWMGYIANVVAIFALIPLPFAGYYLGREIYSHSAVMGNNMMGGDFSWTFIIQAMLVGSLFLISNYYLWSGMTRIPGAERFYKYIKYILGVLIISFAVWLTPHNLPLSAMEIGEMGGSQYHPTLKFLGLMPAKNAVINLIIIATFFSFLLYRRGNKKGTVPISTQGNAPKILIPLAGLFAIGLVGQYAIQLFLMDPGELDLPADRAQYFRTVAYLLFFECFVAAVAVVLALKDRGILAENLYLGVTAFNVTIFLGVYGFIVMEQASPFLRNVAVSQFLQLISSLVLVMAIDLFLYKDADAIGELDWGRMTTRSQFALLLLTFVITMNMGLMGFVRSGLRGDWHIYGVMRDTSGWAFTPSNFT
ncbi:MAG: cytochrome ubiquinol oxidase subunit I, partial [Proteobacteria bacterium]|nr:cytochrome ubiquinol oxidase subunit I [Pseudomonadota bacterium]